MPLDTIGSYAASSSSGAIARNTARSIEGPSAATNGFAAASLRRGTTGGEEIHVSSSPNTAVYVSPFIRVDIQTRLAIMEIRNSQTGEVQQQYPSPRAVREYAQNLPDDSDLRVESQESGARQSSGESNAPRIIGSSEDQAAEAQAASFGQNPGTGGSTAAPAPTASGIARAAAAAFSSAQNALVGARELAVA